MPDDPAGGGERTEREVGSGPAPREGGPSVGIGDRVGRYEILGVIGEGGMSYVYLAHDPELDRDVALKLMRVRVGSEGARRLRREAQALAQLSHPNVVPVYDAGMVGGQAFVAMEYVEGKTLRRWLRSKPPWRQVLSVMIDAGQGLAAAHARGLIHRDFKPDNVLLGDDGRVRVLDFGLARLAGVLDGSIVPSNPSDSIPPSSASPPSSSSSGRALASADALVTRADQLIGTPAYMAPEQVRRDPIDARADLFAFGITLYEALYGMRPFEAPARPQSAGSRERTMTAASITDTTLLRPRTPPRNAGVPRHIQRTVFKALAHDPGDRWPSMDAMLAELRRDPWRPWRRAGVAATAVVAAAAITVGFARPTRDTRAMCHGGATRLDAVWGAHGRDKVRTAFAATKLPYADAAATAVSQALDDYTAKLARGADDACTATRVRGEQSEEALDLRTACYEQRWREVDALVEVLGRADADTVKEAPNATKSLSSIDDCADVAALRAPVPVPKDPAVRSQLDALEQRLAGVMAAYAVGKAADAASQGDALLADARHVGYVPLLARVNLWRGRAFADLSDEEKSVPAFRDAFEEALASRDDGILKLAAVRLAQEYIYAHQPAEFDTWAAVAQSAIDRGAPDVKLQSFLDHTRCVALYNLGKLIDRLACLEHHAAQVEPTRPLDEWELTTLGLAAVDAAQYERGLDYVHRGYEFALKTYGPAHPRTLEMRMYECKAQVDSGDPDAAMATCGEALKAMQQVAADEPALLSRDHLYTAFALIGAKRYEAARAELALAQSLGADESDVLETTAMIDAASGHPARAIPHYREAVAAELHDLPAVHPDVVSARLELGKALLDHHDVGEARKVLEEALETAKDAQLSPTMRADLEFATARVLWASGKPKSTDRVHAIDLARNALAAYVELAPKTSGLKAARDEIEGWVGAQANATSP
ncbi:MAG TPA: serine/threonine-protein kinase [Polyangiaceae bacterium]